MSRVCPDHGGPLRAGESDCWWCTLEWQATDQGAGVALVRGSMPPRARVRPLTTPAPLPLRTDPDQLERTRARLDQHDAQLELQDGPA